MLPWDALSAQERALTFGGLDGISNLSLVESAIARSYTGYYLPIWKKAAALVESMAGNHGFADGNKRTTLFWPARRLPTVIFGSFLLKGRTSKMSLKRSFAPLSSAR